MRFRFGVLVVVWLLVSSVGVAVAGLPPGGSFVDDDGIVHEGAIEAIAAEGITRGCNPPLNDRFCPSDSVTRGQMAAFLVRALGLSNRLVDPFTDDDGSLFEADVERLAAAGVTRGCNPPLNDRFCPDDVVTRGQMAAFLVRALGLSDRLVDPFVDDDGSLFEADVERLAAAGITAGCNPPVNDRFCPDDVVTRAQMASFLTRALHLTPIDPPDTPRLVLEKFKEYWVQGDFTGMASVAEPQAVAEARSWGAVVDLYWYGSCEASDTVCNLAVEHPSGGYLLLFWARFAERSGDLVIVQLVHEGDAG